MRVKAKVLFVRHRTMKQILTMDTSSLCKQTACCSISDRFCLLPIWTGVPPPIKTHQKENKKSIRILSIFLPDSRHQVCTGRGNPEEAVVDFLEKLNYTGEAVDTYSIDEVTIINLDRTCISIYSSECWRSFILFYTKNGSQDTWELIVEDHLNELVLNKEVWYDITLRQIISTVFLCSD